MSKLNIAVYAEGCVYPASAQQPVVTTILQLQQSGFTTAILGLFHIGLNSGSGSPVNTGDLSFNDQLIISEGAYVGDTSWPDLVGSMLGGAVSQVCASVGGGGVGDFQNIQTIYESNGNSFDNTNLLLSFQILRKELPAISVIDMDCEDNYDSQSFVAFCQMLVGIGFGITFCPYQNQPFWTAALSALNASSPGVVKWWNLQCYDGGGDNTPANWAQAIAEVLPGFSPNDFIVAGNWTQVTPATVQTTLQNFDDQSCLGGAFIWTLDAMIANDTLTEYAGAIAAGLGGGS